MQLGLTCPPVFPEMPVVVPAKLDSPSVHWRPNKVFPVTYSNTMTNTLSLFTLIRVGNTVIINSAHGIA